MCAHCVRIGQLIVAVKLFPRATSKETCAQGETFYLSTVWREVQIPLSVDEARESQPQTGF